MLSMASKNTSRRELPSYGGHGWSIAVNAQRSMHEIPDFIVLESPASGRGAVDTGGNAEKVGLYMGMFLHDLSLPFCHLVRDVMDFLGLDPIQLHPNAWRILTSCYVAWCMVFESVGESTLTWSSVRVCSLYDPCSGGDHLQFLLLPQVPSHSTQGVSL